MKQFLGMLGMFVTCSSIAQTDESLLVPPAIINDNGTLTIVFEWAVGSKEQLRGEIIDHAGLVMYCVTFDFKQHTTHITKPDGVLVRGVRTQEIFESRAGSYTSYRMTHVRLIFPAMMVSAQTTLRVLP
jgi:hypothetical protein